MTSVDLAPYWPPVEDWTGFLLVIVPAGPLPIPGAELCRQVRAQIETDAVLYDLVTAKLAPPFEPTTGWDRTILTSVVEAAMPDRHFFAPRGVIGVVVVGSNEQALNDAFDNLLGLPAMSRLWARLFGVGVRTDSRMGVSPTSILKIARTVNALIERYDEQPRIAMSEPEFLNRVGALVKGHHLNQSALQPKPAAHVVQPVLDARFDEVVRVQPARSQRPGRPERSGPPPIEPRQPGPALTAKPTDDPAPLSTPIAMPSPQPAPVVRTQSSTPPAEQPSRRLLEAVMHDGAEIINVDQRTPIQRLMRQNLTDADCMDEMWRGGRAVGLVFLVFVPDDGVVPRSVAKRRNAIALELDQALASVRLDATTGQPARVAVEVLLATNPLQKSGVLRVAGNMTESVLPKVKIEYFSTTETVEPMLDAARRTSRALLARGVEVVSLHFVFLAAMRFPADEMTEGDWIQLLEHARVTWIDFSPADQRQPLHPMPPSPFGLHVLTDKEDIPAVFKNQSEVIYLYAPQQPPHTTTETGGQSEAAAPTETRRWWSFGKRLAGLRFPRYRG